MKADLIVKLPEDGLKKEREYSLTVLLEEFLGLTYEINYHGKPFIELITDQGMISFKDTFFSSYEHPGEYLKQELIPQDIFFFGANEISEQEVPILFGKDRLEVNDVQIDCEADLFASAFFMLSRWEEIANTSKDQHGRFPGNESLAYKKGFLNRPVVNEYAEVLWQMLLKMGLPDKRKSREYTIIPTHDIDDLVFWNETNRKHLGKNLLGDIIKRNDIHLAKERWKSNKRTNRDITQDPYYVYYHLMDQAELENVQATFYFMAAGKSVYDRPYDLNSDVFRNISSQIKERGHHIGLHGSYDTYNDPTLFTEEKKALEKAIDNTIDNGRQHYLRFENPVTANIWEQQGITSDSTLYYSGYPGFRTGSCYSHSLFDVLEQKMLKVSELPLHIMDVCLEEMTSDQAIETVQQIKQEVKKHKGEFVFLVHNSSYGWMHKNANLQKAEQLLYEG